MLLKVFIPLRMSLQVLCDQVIVLESETLATHLSETYLLSTLDCYWSRCQDGINCLEQAKLMQ